MITLTRYVPTHAPTTPGTTSPLPFTSGTRLPHTTPGQTTFGPTVLAHTTPKTTFLQTTPSTNLPKKPSTWWKTLLWIIFALFISIVVGVGIHKVKKLTTIRRRTNSNRPMLSLNNDGYGGNRGLISGFVST